ncbi:MAG: hypothetical protein IJH07_08645 [Ruminococcus sp.]|nr:hypothetical protein [Ruminococcus sp.]
MLVSVLGDSISTFEFFNPKGYAVFYNEFKQLQNGFTSVDETWWEIVCRAMHAEICVNNSYSGSRVTGSGFPAASSTERCGALHTRSRRPDMLLVYIGYNDFGDGVKVYGEDTSGVTEDCSAFFDAYVCMVKRLQEQYPQAAIICGTLMRTYVRNSGWIFLEEYGGVPFDDYNEAIKSACRKTGCYLADTAARGVRLETLDGFHPTAQGHGVFAQEWICCLRDLGFIRS